MINIPRLTSSTGLFIVPDLHCKLMWRKQSVLLYCLLSLRFYQRFVRYSLLATQSGHWETSSMIADIVERMYIL